MLYFPLCSLFFFDTTLQVHAGTIYTLIFVWKTATRAQQFTYLVDNVVVHFTYGWIIESSRYLEDLVLEGYSSVVYGIVESRDIPPSVCPGITRYLQVIKMQFLSLKPRKNG